MDMPAMKAWLEGIEAKFGGIEELKARLQELEQKSVRRGDGGPPRAKSLGEQFVEAKGADLARIATERGRTSMEVKATITTSTANAAGSAGALIVPTRDLTVGMAQRRLTIRQLLNVKPVSGGSVEYAKQTGRTNNAAPVAEGESKPASDLQWALEQTPLRVIAHHVKASRQVLEDVPQLQSMIDVELRYGLALVEEAQLLSGDGTGQNLEGMIPQATAFSAPIVIPDLNKLDVIGLAILQTSLTNTQPDGVVIHPSDWWEMRLSKDSQGRYLLGDPQSSVPPNLFGLPVVTTEAMTADKFLVGAFGEQTLYDRWTARVEVGFVNDDFIKNLVTILGEERIGFAAKRPDALIYGDFGDALAA